MEENLKSIFLSTLHSNDEVRRKAEEELKKIEKDPQTMAIIQNLLMRNQNLIVSQTSSIYFANNLHNNWKSPELSFFIHELQSNFMKYLLIEDKFPNQAYEKILQSIFEFSSSEGTLLLIENACRFLASSEDIEIKAALRVFQAIFKADSLKFNLEPFFKVIFDKHGDVFMSKFTYYLNKQNYVLGKMFMKVLSRSYSHYSLPKFLLNLKIFQNCFNIAVQITKLNIQNDIFAIKMKKWAVFFLYKCSNKGLKRYFKNMEFVTFIKSSETISILLEVFMNITNDFSEGKVIHRKIPIYACYFYILVASTKHTIPIIKPSAFSLIKNFILPIQQFNEETQDIFEGDPEQYLRNRYNYVEDDLYSESRTLFSEILKIDDENNLLILDCFKNIIDRPSLPDHLKLKYAIIGLLADNQAKIEKIWGQKAYHQFIINYIFPDLNSEHRFLRSQALFFLSRSEEILIDHESVENAFDRVVSIILSEDEALAVEACISINFFLYNPRIFNKLKPIIAGLLEKILLFSKQYFLETLSSLMDSIVEYFSEDITFFAPQFIATLCSNILEQLSSNISNDKVAAISGFVTTVEKMIMIVDSKPDIVAKFYQSFHPVAHIIFSTRLQEFYQEAFDVMNSFLFVLKRVDQMMCDIFILALSIDNDDILLFPHEISDFIDNYLSFAKAALINNHTLELILKTLSVYFPDDEDIYDDDFECGCKIVNSLMLNAGMAVNTLNPHIIPHIVNMMFSKYDTFDESGYTSMFALESIMSCFLISSNSTLMSLNSNLSKFFNEIYKYRHKFKRVYDKKIYILFIGELFKLSPTFEIIYERINEGLADILCSLPEAIKKRNNKKDEENKEVEAKENSEEERYSSDYTVESIEEDIWFETDLDKFNPYNYVKCMLSSPISNSIGQLCISYMNQNQIQRINHILDNEQEAEK